MASNFKWQIWTQKFQVQTGSNKKFGKTRLNFQNQCQTNFENEGTKNSKRLQEQLTWYYVWLLRVGEPIKSMRWPSKTTPWKKYPNNPKKTRPEGDILHNEHHLGRKRQNNPKQKHQSKINYDHQSHNTAPHNRNDKIRPNKQKIHSN